MTHQHDHLPIAAPQAERQRIITVIVPTYNDPRLPLCLQALHDLDVPAGSSVEVIVVDNGSDESPRELVEGYPGTTFLVEPRRGSYAARNTGLGVARGDLVAFTDSDCRPARDWLVAAVRRLDGDPGVAAVAGRVETVFDSGRPRSPAGWWSAIHAFPQESYVGEGWGVTANLVVRRTAGDALGWFDATVQSGGDQDFGRRLTGSGLVLVYEPAAVVAHPARTTWRETLTKTRRTAKGNGRLEATAGAGPRQLLRALRWFVRELVRVLKRGLRDDGLPDASARFQYVLAGFVVRTYGFAERWRWRRHYARAAAGGATTQG